MWTILPHLTACVAGDGLILLELRRDRYFRVPPREAPKMRAWFEHGGGPAPADIATLLVKSGLVAPKDIEAISATAQPVVIPEAAPEQGRAPPLPGLGAYSVARRVFATWLALRTRRLESVIRSHRRQRRSACPTDAVDCSAPLLAYHRARRLVPIARNCLLDSLALDRWLGETGPPRTIVIGVTSEPFLAHCWLQTEHLLLNDSPDHVRRYAPILLV